MKLKRLMFMLLALAGLSACSKQPADLIFVNGELITMETETPRAGALVVTGDRIVFVGTRSEAESKYRVARTIDLNGRALIPGLIDGHAHLFNLGKYLSEVDLVGTQSLDEVLELVQAKVEKTPEGGWIVGRGWDQNDWPDQQFPDHKMLSTISPNHPVALTRIDGHAVLANAKAMQLGNIGKNTPAPAGGKIVRDRSGNPTGVFVDNAKTLVNRHIPPPDKEQLKERLRLAVQSCHENGLVGIHDAGVTQDEIDAAMEMAASGEFDFRWYVMLDGSQPDLLNRYFESGPQIGLHNDRITIRSVKLYADGALGSRGALLLEPYSDDPGNRGLQLTSSDELLGITRKAVAAGFQVGVHAIGDGANRTVLDVYAGLMKEMPGVGNRRLRIEHVQVLNPDDLPRFSQLGVLAAMQPTHCTSDMYWAVDRLGEERSLGAYAWQSLKKSGARLVFGSDFPVEAVNPLLGIYAAVTRQDLKEYPEGGWHPSERISVDEALQGFTVDAAFGAFREEITGSLKPGKLADLTVLSKDITAIPPHEIPETIVDMTFVGGKSVFERHK